MSEEPKTPTKLVEEEPIITTQTFGGIQCKAHAGRLPLKGEDGEIEAQVFYVAYIKEDPREAREKRLLFVFNGGPGSPSIWLHMGALGPVRAKMQEDGSLPSQPYSSEVNPESWLEEFDLVFVDPVGTGYSRAKDDKTGEKFWGLKGDLDSIAEFIRLYLVRSGRTASPFYLCGESYGTTRCAGLAGILTNKGLPPKGVILISSVLNFQTLEFRKGNDLPYALFLPTYTATAHFHGRLSGSQSDLIARSKSFALNEYWVALAKGSLLKGDERKAILSELTALTGLSEEYLEECDLRPVIYDFCKELLRGDRRTVGRLDSRIKGIENRHSWKNQRGDSDPSMDILMGPYLTIFTEYVSGTLGYKTDFEYSIFNGVKKPWDWGSSREGYPDTSHDLTTAMSKNPYLRVFVASGLFDLATPFFATEYTFSHMGLDESLEGNVTVKEYQAGHMMYIDTKCLSSLKKDVSDWVESTTV